MTTNVIECPANTAEANEFLDLEGIQLKREEISDPSAFLASERGKAWLAPILSGAYFTMWYDHQRGSYDISTCNEIAGKVLEAKYQSTCPGEFESILEDHFEGGNTAEDVYDEDHESDIKNKIESLAEDIVDLEDDELDCLDVEAWCDEIRNIVIEHMYENDDSSVRDMFSSFDRFELVIRLDPDSDHISVDNSWADFDKLVIDQTLQNTLARLGYTLKDYRKMSKRTSLRNHKGEQTGAKVPVRGQPLLTENELRSLVNEACASSFSIVLYAWVSLNELFDLDLTKPVVMSNCSIASYNSMSGTFFDVSRKEAVILDPKHDRLTEAWGYRPEQICGLYMPAFEAKIANA